MTVLDASALLAMLFREAGHEIVAAELGTACISTVNLAEVLGRFARDGMDPAQFRQRIESSLEVVPFSSAHASICARLLPETRKFGLSLGDRACLALARERNVAALTADRAWADLDLGVAVRLLR